MGKVEYIRCPRCELNFIEKSQKLCKVCEQELASKGNKELTDEEVKEMNLCPICKTNYLMDDEEICDECASEKAALDNNDDFNISTDEQSDDTEDKTDNWRQYVENDDAELPEDEFGDMTSITTEEDSDEILDDEDMEFDEKDEEFEEEFEDEFEDDFDESFDEDEDFDEDDDENDEDDDDEEDDE